MRRFWPRKQPLINRTFWGRLRTALCAVPLLSPVSWTISRHERPCEILALRWRRIDLPQNTIEVAETYSSGEFGPPNTRSSRRTIPISASLAEVFKQLRPQNCEPERLVFATSKGTPRNPKNLCNQQLAPACDAIELPRISWHSFRHTHATLLHEAGESEDGPSPIRALGFGDDAGSAHADNSGLATAGGGAGGRGFGPSWTQLPSGRNSGGTDKRIN